jgi:hypothetical protein
MTDFQVVWIREIFADIASHLKVILIARMRLKSPFRPLPVPSRGAGLGDFQVYLYKD